MLTALMPSGIITDAFSARRFHQSKNKVVLEVLPCKNPNTSTKKKRTYCGLLSFSFKVFTISKQPSNKLDAVNFKISTLNLHSFKIANKVFVLEIFNSRKNKMYCA